MEIQLLLTVGDRATPAGSTSFASDWSDPKSNIPTAYKTYTSVIGSVLAGDPLYKTAAKGFLSSQGLGLVAEGADLLTKGAQSIAPKNKAWQRFTQYGPLGALYSVIFE